MRRCLAAPVAAVLAIVCALWTAALGASPALGAEPPYIDYAAQGYLTFYDPSNTAITGGDVNVRPFVWRAVGSEPAPPPYDGAGRKATLLAYIPREGANVDDWSGDILTLSTPYTDAAHPKAQATVEDFSLADLFSYLPPLWDGFVQIRMYYSMPEAAPVTTEYAATDIQIIGDRWTVVRGGSPVEEADPPAPSAPSTVSPGDGAAPGSPGASGGASGAGSEGGTPGGTVGAAGPTEAPVDPQGTGTAESAGTQSVVNAAAGGDGEGGGGTALAVTIAILAAMALGAGALFLVVGRRTRRE